MIKDKMKNNDSTWNKFWNAFFYSFPIQLFLNHFKKNQILLILWLVLFGFVSQSMGKMMGIPSLFLDPEYLSTTDYKGFFIIGVTLGVFITSFHITVYILDSFRFPFLGSIPKPFAHFCLNNSLIPTLFVVIYIANIISFQHNLGFQKASDIALEVSAFLLGLSFMILILFLYFKKTNHDVFKEMSENLDRSFKRNTLSRVNVMKEYKNFKRNKHKVTNYLSLNVRFKKTENSVDIDKAILLRVFDQNHLNAVIVELILIAAIVLLGLFRDNNYFQIPAAASGILFFSMIIMFTGAFSYWLRGWAITSLVIFLLLINLLLKYDIIQSTFQAYGIDYNKPYTTYNLSKLRELNNPRIVQSDIDSTIKILENWKAKFQGKEKPKMVIVCSSGGGQRAAVWSLRTLQVADSITDGKLMKHTQLLTGASGGMIGACYYRELYHQKHMGKDIDLCSPKYFNNISKDILNPIIFSMVVNDLFFRFQKFSDGKYEYFKDRGYAFEQKIHENTEYVMYKKLKEYKDVEKQSIIPMAIISPTIINDGRRLYISPQPISYMNTNTSSSNESFQTKIKGIEFTRFFEDHNAMNLHFMTALRMSATFPYVTPNIELPSTPTMEIMDAGLTDNFGVRDAIKFLFVFNKWISENTSGVIFVQIRDSEKDQEVERSERNSAFQKIFSPIGSLYDNWDYYQDLNNDNLIEYAQTWLNVPLHVVPFEYIPKPKLWNLLKEKNIQTLDVNKKKNERAVLSWHLTTREKESIRRTIYESNNQASLNKLHRLLDEE
jgi:hypothetical protein